MKNQQKNHFWNIVLFTRFNLVICQCTCGQQWRAVGLVADIGEGPDGGRRGLGAQAVTQSHHEVLVHGPQARIACMASGVEQISF